jgi:cytochrome b subunit of formate dehydrogenase
MMYYLGLRSEKPKFARFNYAEKAEYWALVWGTALMGLTGVMIWAKVWVGDTLARWWVDIATAIHFYEAILATLAIVVWHFYQVFSIRCLPDELGVVGRQDAGGALRHEHGLDTETLEEGKKEE